MAAKSLILSTNDVCQIIEASAKAGVTELKFGGLHVRFGKTVEQKELGASPSPVQHAPQSYSVADLTEEQHQTQSRQSLEDEEIKTREERLARLLVEDPMAYEQMLRDGELTDAVDSADDGDDE